MSLAILQKITKNLKPISKEQLNKIGRNMLTQIINKDTPLRNKNNLTVDRSNLDTD